EDVDPAGTALPERVESVPVDERDDRLEEGEELLRDPCHRIPDRRRAGLGLKRGSPQTGIALRELQGKRCSQTGMDAAVPSDAVATLSFLSSAVCRLSALRRSGILTPSR